MSERQVCRELDGLEKDGWITRTERRNHKEGIYQSDVIQILESRGAPLDRDHKLDNASTGMWV